MAVLYVHGLESTIVTISQLQRHTFRTLSADENIIVVFKIEDEAVMLYLALSRSHATTPAP